MFAKSKSQAKIKPVLDRECLQSDLEYKLIDGSLHIPLQELEDVQTILPYKDQEIVTYCAGSNTLDDSI